MLIEHLFGVGGAYATLKPSPDWQALRISVNDRADIYAETFPGQLNQAGQAAIDWFTHDQAHALLYTFAGA